MLRELLLLESQDFCPLSSFSGRTTRKDCGCNAYRRGLVISFFFSLKEFILKKVAGKIISINMGSIIKRREKMRIFHVS